MPEAEMMYVPFGTTHVPPPASATDFKAALNASVSFVLPSPTAPYVLTSATVWPLVAGAAGSGAFWQYPRGNCRTSKALAAPIRKNGSGRVCPINGDMNLETIY